MHEIQCTRAHVSTTSASSDEFARGLGLGGPVASPRPGPGITTARPKCDAAVPAMAAWLFQLFIIADTLPVASQRARPRARHRAHIEHGATHGLQLWRCQPARVAPRQPSLHGPAQHLQPCGPSVQGHPPPSRGPSTGSPPSAAAPALARQGPREQGREAGYCPACWKDRVSNSPASKSCSVPSAKLTRTRPSAKRISLVPSG